MNTWSNQNQVPNNNMVVGQAQFNPYNPSWTMPQKLPIYSAAPIHGREAAWQFPMGPNSEIYLPDADQDIIWWIRTDANGNKNVQGFDVVPHEDPKPVDVNEILTRLSAVEEWINGKSNKSNAKRNATVPVTNGPVGTTEQVN